MPLHDWTRVRPKYYHTFHGGWLYAIYNLLNSGLLPRGYYALAEHTAGPFGPDVLTLEKPGPPDPVANGHADGTGGPAVRTVTAAPPKVRFAAAAEPVPLPLGQRRLTVRNEADHRLVAVIELVSPANRKSQDDPRAFVGKAAGVLDAGVHLLVIDPFPPRKRLPNGMHGAIWKAVTGEAFALPEGKLRTVASYVSGEEYQTFAEVVAVGDALPDMPLFLTGDQYIDVPLEATYETAWRPYPDHWKAVLTAP